MVARSGEKYFRAGKAEGNGYTNVIFLDLINMVLGQIAQQKKQL